MASESVAQVISSGVTACPTVAITFDLCPVRKGPGFDPELIQLLKDRKVPATMFLSGRWVLTHESETETLLSVPFFEIGTHGYRHAHLPLLDREAQAAEILEAISLVSTRFHRPTTLFRPPYGEYTEETVSVVRDLGQRFIYWDVVSGDPDPSLTAEKMLARVGRAVRRGSILIFHANGKGRHTREVVDRLTAEVLPKKGLTPVTVSELLSCQSGTPMSSSR
jgi:peptidoglycan/xylan/chitin deacetylase (PgdA/CDA1 family)